MIKILNALTLITILSLQTTDTLSLTVTVGGTGVKNTAGDKKWQKYKENVESNSNGTINMRMLVYGELGPEENLVNGIRRGRIQVANWSGLATTTVVPEMAMLYIPFLFDDYQEADFIMDNYLFEAFSKLLAKKDVYFLQWDEIGFNQIYGKTPILLPSDLTGKRFRTSSSNSARLFAESIKADAIPLGFTDIVTGLQTGLVEYGENAIIMYVPTGIAEEAPHLTITNHSFATSIIVIRKKWLEKLDGFQKNIITSSFVDLENSRSWTRDEWKAFLQNENKYNFKVHSLTTQQREKWKKETSIVSKKLIDSIGGKAYEIWELVQEGKSEFILKNK